MLRRFPEALRKLDEVLNITPDDVGVLAIKASIAQAEGDLPRAAALLKPARSNADDSSTLGTRIYQATLERDPAQIIPRVKEELAKSDPALGFHTGELRFWLGWAQELAGNHADAQKSWRQARSELEPLLKEQPDNWNLMANLALTNMGLSDKAAAFALLERAMAAVPLEKDALDGPGPIEILARVAAQLGEPDRAISALRKLLSIPSPSLPPLTPALLRLDPMFDPLRGDPRFEELCKDKLERSIAVLPFDNLSRDPDNAYFAEGIQEEILTRLAKIGGLKVISRTSTQRYQSKPGNLSEIAKQLGVANILEGSVQRAADRVRVNVQLVNAQTDSHLWANTYDRKLTDIFGIESEIAKTIAEALQSKLTGGEERALAVKPTNNPEAYDAYLRGLAFDARSGITSYSFPSPSLKAIGSYERAVQLDPDFALAWARLSRANAQLYFSGGDPTPETRRDAATSALENAQKLEPDSPETLLALGYYQYWVLRNYGAAKTTFDRVSKMLPSSSEVPRALAAITRGEGRWNERIAYYDQALTLDPRNVELLWQVAWTYGLLRQFPAALKLYDRALDLMPNDPDLIAAKASMYLAQGNLQEAAKLLVEVNAQTKSDFVFQTKITQLKLERNYAEAVRLLQTRLAQFHFATQDNKGAQQMALAFMQRFAGNTVEARVTAEQAYNTFEQLYKDRQGDFWIAFRAAWLSGARAAMGQKDSALKEAERAIVLLPRDKDPVFGPALEENLALIHTFFGENSRAISTLTRLLQAAYNSWTYAPTPITRALLRLDPIWDPLRGDPAFQRLCEEEQP
jgi:TolB-like protein/predicted Zn-dependent protease